METKLPEGQAPLTYEQVLEDLKKRSAGDTPSLIKGKIVDILVKQAGEIFGDKVIVDYPDNATPEEKKKILEEAKSRTMIQVVIDTGYEFDVRENFNPSNDERSRWVQFQKSYRGIPKAGMEVNLMKKPGKDGRQYYKLVL